MNPLWLACLLTAQVAPLTVDEAVQIGVERAFAVQIAQSQHEQARQRSRQALGLLGFRVESSAVYQRYLTTQVFGPGSSQIESKSASLSISYPLDLSGLGRKAALAARNNEWAFNEAIATEVNATKKRIREAFYGVIRADEAVRVQEANLKAAELRLSNAQKRFDVGDISKFDLIRLETAVSQANAAQENAIANLRLAEQILNNALSRPIETPVSATGTLNLPEVATASDALVAKAMETRPELRQLKYLLVSRQFFTYTEGGGLSPSIKVGVNYQHIFGANAFQRENQTTLEARLTWPLFDAGITRAKQAAAKEDERQTEISIERTITAISLEVRSAKVRFENALDQYRAAQRTVELQQEAVRIADVRFNAGEGILLDLTQAQADLTLAQVNLVNARYEVWTAYSALQAAVGADEL